MPYCKECWLLCPLHKAVTLASRAALSRCVHRLPLPDLLKVLGSGGPAHNTAQLSSAQQMPKRQLLGRAYQSHEPVPAPAEPSGPIASMLSFPSLSSVSTRFFSFARCSKQMKQNETLASFSSSFFSVDT